MMAMMAKSADAALPATGCSNGREIRQDLRSRDGSRFRDEQAPRSAGTEAGPDEALTLEVAARDYMWLYDYRHGVSLKEIAGYEGLTVAEVQRGVERSKAQESKLSRDDVIEGLKSGRLEDMGFRLIPLFPVSALTPQSACPHHGAIESGSRLCCMVCHGSGMDDHPAMQRDPKIDPSPESGLEPAAAPPSQSGESKETRRQRRRRKLAEAGVS